MYEKIDLNNFWNSDSEYDDLKSEPFSEETLRDIEKDLGYKFPQSYIALMRVQNGGCPENTSVGNTGWVIGSIYGISKDTDFRFWTDEDLAPLIPVCTSAGDSDMIFLDYRKCGCDGEPGVVGISQDMNTNTISFIAKDFESFINMLVPLENDEEDEPYFDPYEGIHFTPVEGEQRKELDRVIWGDLPWGIGFTAFWLLVIIALFFFHNAFFVTLRFLSFFPAAYGFIGTVACLTDCISKSKKTYESYVDTVDAVWEANEPLHKTKDDGKKKKYFLRLKKSKVDMYRNTEGFKEGDLVRVYRPQKGEVILVKEDAKKQNGEQNDSL